MSVKRIVRVLVVVVAALVCWPDVVAADPFEKLDKVLVFPLEGVNVHETVCRAATYNLISELRDRGKAVVDYQLVELEIQEAESPLLDAVMRRKISEALGADGYLTGSLVALGERERAREWLARAIAIDPDDILTQYNVACVHSRLGDHDKAFDLLERLLPRANHETKSWIQHDSDFDALRSLPRYQRVLELIQ